MLPMLEESLHSQVIRLCSCRIERESAFTLFFSHAPATQETAPQGPLMDLLETLHISDLTDLAKNATPAQVARTSISALPANWEA